MGCAISKDEKVAFDKSRDNDRQLKEDCLERERDVKLLLLGTGESGKSTIMKQIKIIHDGGFKNLVHYRPIVYSNTIQSMGAIIRGMKKLDIPFENFEREKDATMIINTLLAFKEMEPFTHKLSSALKLLWADLGVCECFQRSNEYQLNDSASHFLNNIDRISSQDFVPNEEDILRLRVKTIGIVELIFMYKDRNFTIFDVGGQQSERKKWIHCFENVTAIIFCVALSEFDQVLMEDEATNRMNESLNLFETVCNIHWFHNSSFILFLNKKDLFMEKLQKKSITVCFPEYEGSQDFDQSCQYIESCFRKKNRNEFKEIYAHTTCATDTINMQFVLDVTTDVVIKANLRNCGLF